MVENHTSYVYLGLLNISIKIVNNEDGNSRGVFVKENQFIGWNADLSLGLDDKEIKEQRNLY